MLRRSWWKFYDPALLADDNIQQLPAFEQIVASWDTAFKDTNTSDFVVGQVWGIHQADRYLLYGFRRRANLNATKDAMRAAYNWVERRWPNVAHKILIEKSANGVDIIAELSRELPGVLPITVVGDKIIRAMAAQPPLEAGNIFVPGRAVPNSTTGYQAPGWVADLIEEAATFPNGQHDDQVDAYSQAINWARINPPLRWGTRSSVSRPRGRIPGVRTHDDRLHHYRNI